MKISRFKKYVAEDSCSPQISFCVNISTDELALYNYNSTPISLEARERAFGKMMLEKITTAMIKDLKV